MLALQLGHRRTQVKVQAVWHRGNAIPSEGMLKCAFADFSGVINSREHYVGYYAAVLSAFAGDSIELRFSQLEFAVLQLHQLLHGTFAE